MVSQTPVIPAAAALAVWMDGAHTMEFSMGSDSVTISLRHQREAGQSNSDLPQGHQHGLLTRAVLTFAQSQGGAHPDHKLSLKTAHDAFEPSSAVPLLIKKQAPQLLLITLVHPWLDLSCPQDASDHLPSQDGSIATPGLVGLRTVVMLI